MTSMLARGFLLIGFGMSSPVLASCPGQWFLEGPFRGTGAVLALTNWDPDGPGPAGTGVVAAGTFSGVDGVEGTARLAFFDGASWSRIGTVNLGGSVTLRAVAVHPDGSLIIAGEFTSIAGVPAANIARWDGRAWSSLGSGVQGSGLGIVRALAIRSNGDIIAGGGFTGAGGAPAPGIARWTGSAWVSMSDTLTYSGPGSTAAIRSLVALPNGHIIAGGTFSEIDGVAAASLAEWDGSEWIEVGGGVYRAAPFATSVEGLERAGNGDLYICGGFTSAGNILTGGEVPVRGVARWDGVSWWNMTGGLEPLQTIHAIDLIDNGELVAGNWRGDIGGVEVDGAARWDGVEWHAFNDFSSNVVYAVLGHESGEIFVGANAGSSSSGTSLGRLARWTPDGVPWIVTHPVNASVEASEGAAFSVVPAGGYGSLAGGVSLAYQWQYRATPGNGAWTELEDGTVGGFASITGSSTGMLMLGSLGDAAGEYRCVIGNGCGQAISHSAVLTIASACRGDIAGPGGTPDGVVNVEDLNAILAVWGMNVGVGSPPDIAGDDGVVNADDLNVVLSSWGSVCP
ncbi:MAG: delta-60 repeat domain-containing protein [Phycisphaerales bacterium]|nr:delta-60 repeat domain-containing protein [Phycisphaerales bacterium]